MCECCGNIPCDCASQEKPVAHTPAPWNLEDEGYEERLVVTGDSGAKPIACVYTSFYSPEHDVDAEEIERDEEEYAANARLIVAAPELLEALKHALERLNEIRHDYSDTDFAMINSAISKATQA